MLKLHQKRTFLFRARSFIAKHGVLLVIRMVVVFEGWPFQLWPRRMVVDGWSCWCSKLCRLTRHRTQLGMFSVSHKASCKRPNHLRSCKRPIVWPSGPGRPANLTVITVSSTSLTVGWDPPSPPLCDITEYRIKCQGDGCNGRRTHSIPESRDCRADSALGRQCSATVKDLKEVTTYTILVGGGADTQSMVVLRCDRIDSWLSLFVCLLGL